MYFDRLNKLFKADNDSRTSLINKNITVTFLIKGISVIISLLYVPVTLDYLDSTRYGIWMTLTSIVAWISIFDIGLGNGLRNKLTESLTRKDYDTAKKYVSTTYAILTIIIIVILAIYYIINRLIDWSTILNTPKEYAIELSKLALIVITLFGFRFILNTISIIVISDQKPAISSLIETIGNGLGLIIIYLLTKIGNSSLITFGWATMLSPVVIYIASSIILFNNRYNYIKPSIYSIRFSYAKDLLNLGIQFFVIQIAVLVIFQTGNILIAQLFSPEEVTPYNIIHKYFNVAIMIWGIIMTPFWSAFTQAHILNDVKWMKVTMRKLNKLIIYTFAILIMMAFFAPTIIKLWTSGKVSVSSDMIWIFAFYTFISIWNNIYANFLNGLSKTKIQILTSVLAALINIPLSIIFVKSLNMNASGVVLAMSISLSLFAIAGPIQTFKIIKQWSKN